MDSIFDIVGIIFKFIYGVVLFYIGYLFLKMISLGSFPKNTKKALLYPGPILMSTLGILVIMGIVQIVFFIYNKNI